MDEKLTDKEFSTLKIKLNVGDVSVKQGDRFLVKFIGRKIYLPRINLANGKLQIKQKVNLISLKENKNANLQVVLPQAHY